MGWRRSLCHALCCEGTTGIVVVLVAQVVEVVGGGVLAHIGGGGSVGQLRPVHVGWQKAARKLETWVEVLGGLLSLPGLEVLLSE